MPFTPAIGLFLQLHQRLLDIQEMTLENLIHQHREKARAFREVLETLPFGTLPARPSNAMTAVTCRGFDAAEIVRVLRTEHAVEVAPNGGALQSRVFRVSHMGEHDAEDCQALVEALGEIAARLSRPAASSARATGDA